MINLAIIGAMTAKGKRGVSKAGWIEEALKVLVDGNVADLSIGGLARSLGISRAGFYWHFRNRQELLDELLAYWIHESTEITTSNTMIEELAPCDRLIETARMVHDYDLARYELAIRQWARIDDNAHKAVRQVDRLRYGFILQAFEDLGFEGDDLEMRTMMFVAYQTGEAIFLAGVPKKRRRELIQKRVSFLTSK